jgi:deoxyribonuclease-4
LDGLALRLGLHVSIQGELDEAVDRAVQKGCNTMQMFTRSPRGWGCRPFDEGVVACFKEKLAESGISPVFAHMPYLPNLASPRIEVYERSVETLRVELDRCALLGVPYLVTHLGSSLGAGKEAGLSRITDAIDVAVAGSQGGAMILLENTAGSSNSMGSSFEEIRRVIDGVGQRSRIGICLDTCHAFAAGYDLATSECLKNVLRRFDDVLGWERLRLVHLNDSKGGLRSRWDRHEHIGLGRIGKIGIMNILASSLGRLPLILETPIDERRDDVGNLSEVRGLATMALGG